MVRKREAGDSSNDRAKLARFKLHQAVESLLYFSLNLRSPLRYRLRNETFTRRVLPLTSRTSGRPTTTFL